MDAGFDFFELGFGDVGAAFLVLAHEGIVDADIAGNGADINHGLVLKEGGYVELEMGKSCLASATLVPLPRSVKPFFTASLLSLYQFIVSTISDTKI